MKKIGKVLYFQSKDYWEFRPRIKSRYLKVFSVKCGRFAVGGCWQFSERLGPTGKITTLNLSTYGWQAATKAFLKTLNKGPCFRASDLVLVKGPLFEKQKTYP